MYKQKRQGQNEGNRRIYRIKKLLMSQKIPSHLMAWVCMAACLTGSFVFINDVTADTSSRMKSEVSTGLYFQIFFPSPQIQPKTHGTALYSADAQ